MSSGVSVAAATDAAATLLLDGKASCVGIDIRGTLGGPPTFVPEASWDGGTTYTAVPMMVPTAVAPVVSVLSATAVGVFVAACPAATHFRLRRSVAGTGVATVTLTPGTAGLNYGIAVALS